MKHPIDMAIETGIAVGIIAAFDYLYNTSGDAFALEVFGEDHHPDYLHEKALQYAESPSRAFRHLDGVHTIKMVMAIRSKSAAEAHDLFIRAKAEFEAAQQ